MNVHTVEKIWIMGQKHSNLGCGNGETTANHNVAFSNRNSEIRCTVLPRHTGSVWSVAWSPDSTRIVSGSRDGTIRIWEGIGDGSRQIQTHISPLVCTDVRKTIVSYR